MAAVSMTRSLGSRLSSLVQQLPQRTLHRTGPRDQRASTAEALRNRIQPAPAQGMAAQQPPARQQRSAHRTMTQDSLGRVLRAAWRKAAGGWQHGREPSLVARQQLQQ